MWGENSRYVRTSLHSFLTLHAAAAEFQAFCRVGAVGGGVYMLRCPVQGVLLESEASAEAPPRSEDARHRVVGIRTYDGQTIRCSALAGNVETLTGLLPGDFIPSLGWLARAIVVTDSPLQVSPC